MHRIALVLHDTAMLYEVAIASEIFGTDRPDRAPAGEWYDLVICTAEGGPHPWLPNVRTAGYAEIAHVDTVVVPSADELDDRVDPALIDALVAAQRRGTRLAALCTGAFVLAAAGVLDGRVATTHWMHAEDLARRYPQVDVQPDILYVDDGGVLTSAGKTAALDLCLHLVRRDYGAAVANAMARRMVVPAHRTGGQAQFITPPAAPRSPDGLAPTLEWARARLDQPLAVADLAAKAHLSPRQLTRRMQTELEASPLDWLHRQRLARAQELLESTDASIDQIATSCGMGTATTLRRHFHRTLGITPTAYRTTFRLTDDPQLGP
ncbi:helix-turn-helix domain-containing protein [Nocardioides sp. NPDC004968]|uniref:GlxA family transcriptional regulator n=1 Tax=Nocardioides sp. NPDC004968 TaxID=3155894 RepID=UPI0033ADC38A